MPRWKPLLQRIAELEVVNRYRPALADCLAPDSGFLERIGGLLCKHRAFFHYLIGPGVQGELFLFIVIEVDIAELAGS